MSQKAVRCIFLIYGILLSILIIGSGFLLILGCVAIYRSGPAPFRPELIALCFQRIALPVYVSLGGIALGAVLSLALPTDTRRVKPRRRAQDMMKRLSDAYDLRTVSYETEEGFYRETRSRRRQTVKAIIVCAVCALLAFVWCLIPAHFKGVDKNADIRMASIVVLAVTAVALVTCAVAMFRKDASYRRQSEIVKAAIADKTIEKRTDETDIRSFVLFGRWFSIDLNRVVASKVWVLWGIRGAVFVVAVVFLIVGIFNGGMRDVLGKAINICTECIGLG